MNSLKAAWFGTEINRVYAQGRRASIEQLCDVYQSQITRANLAEHLPYLGDVEVIFATWGMPPLTSSQLEQMPALRAVFYAAGTVQGFARPFLERGITVISAWEANGVPVAEWTLAHILLANKGYFRNEYQCRTPSGRKGAFHGPGNFGETVSLLGVGAVGRKVIELLKPFVLRVAVFDPFLSAENARRLGVEQVSLEEAFERGAVVSNHLADNAQTVGMLHGGLFRLMRANATFINTGRGATVREDEMVAALCQRPDLTALLDVTHPEPPLPNSPLYELPNVRLTSHLAGSSGDEVVRMADVMLEEFHAYLENRPFRYDISLGRLEILA